MGQTQSATAGCDGATSRHRVEIGLGHREQQYMITILASSPDSPLGLRTIFRTVCGLAVAVIVAALFLYGALTAWDRFLYIPSLYSSNLRSVLSMGRIVLLMLGGLIFGIIGGRIAPISIKLQILVCCIAVGYWLLPYGFLEGTFLPIVPLAGILVAASGVYLGHRIVSSYRTV
jgi:hypothetical protein